MALDTDLSLAPYFDDFEANSNQYAVLYRPGVPVQAREMNEAQSIIQDQIDKFGRSIYKEGSVIEGCAFTFDNKYAYVKIKDTYSNGSAFTISDFVGRIATNSNGLKATIVNAVTGFESQDPDLNTIYIKYLNSGTYSNGAPQLTFSNTENLQIATSSNVAIGNVTVATVANSAGFGYAMTVTEGVIFKKGYFIRVPNQTAIVDKYYNQPNNVSVGFGVIEDIETPASNTQLYDNAQGAPNYGAPGAHRLKLTPNLVIRETSDIANTSTFFSVCDFNGGKPVTIKTDPQYSALGTQLAKRTYETNGDFVVNPFLLSTETKKANNDVANTTANTTHLNLVSSPGLAYAKGHRVEFLNRNSSDLRKGNTNTALLTSRISANFGYYVYCDNFVGDFNTDNFAQVELHSIAYDAISNGTFLSTSRDASKQIGTAYIRGIEYSSGTPGMSDAQYIVYLFNIKMNAGANFSQVKSILYYDSTVKAVGDILLTYDYSSNTYIAKIEENAISTMVFPFGQKAVKPESISNISYVYRNRANSTSFDTAGNMTLNLTGVNEVFNYGIGTLSQTQMENFILIPQVNGYSANNTGTVTTSNTTSNVIGSGTNFTANYRVGDVIYVSNSTVANSTHSRVISSITNSTHLSVNSPFPNTAVFVGGTHQLKFAAGQPIPMLNRTGRSIQITSTTAANISLGLTPNAAFGVTVYHDVLQQSAAPLGKTVTRGTLVKIDTSNNVNGTTGPWCLGITDALKINHVWVSTGSYSSSVADSISSFSLDNGQRDSFYDLAYLKSNVTSLPPGSLILVSVDHFEHSTSSGKGFFTAASYPIDDATPSNTTIITAEIPRFTSPSKGSVFDLRDSVDFRPYVANTATITSNIGSATVNPNTTITFSGVTDSSIPSGVDGSYIIAPNQLFEADLSYYLPRRDRVSVTTGGQLLITEGISDPNPRAPAEQPGTMSLGIIDVPPYPTLSAVDAKTYDRYDYAPTINLSQIKRYTMSDIGTLANRITNLEYYTSLSLLEQSAANLLVRSGTTGQNRFKNGILVDPFKGHDIGNTLHPQYSIAVDSTRQEARPFFRTWSEQLVVDTTLSTNIRISGHKILPDFTETKLQSQPYASKFHNCVEGNIYNWVGSINMYPPGDMTPDRTTSPAVVNNLDLASNWINLQAQQAWGTSWGNWVTTNSSTAYGSPYQTGASSSTTNADGSISSTYYTNINTTTTTQQVRTGSQLSLTTSNNELNLGTFVTDISIQPYVSAQRVFFSARGLKPGSVVYPFFNNTPVINYCVPMFVYSGTIDTTLNIPRTSNGQPLFVITAPGVESNTNTYYNSNNGVWGDTFRVQTDGTVRGIFAIPAATFKSGVDLEFKLVDVSDLTQGESAISTKASTTWMTSGLSLASGSSILNTRQAQLNTTQVVDGRVIQQDSVVAGPPIIITTPPPPPPASAFQTATSGLLIWQGYNNSGGGLGGSLSYYWGDTNGVPVDTGFDVWGRPTGSSIPGSYPGQ